MLQWYKKKTCRIWCKSLYCDCTSDTLCPRLSLPLSLFLYIYLTYRPLIVKCLLSILLPGHMFQFFWETVFSGNLVLGERARQSVSAQELHGSVRLRAYHPCYKNWGLELCGLRRGGRLFQSHSQLLKQKSFILKIFWPSHYFLNF